MKVVAFFFSTLFIILYSLFVILASPAHAAGCAMSASPTEIPSHGSFTVSLSNLSPGTEYIIVFDETGFNVIWIANSSGTFNTNVSVDQIFGASDPRSSSGSFLVRSGTTSAEGTTGSEVCSPTGGITIVVNPGLYATPTPYSTPYSTPYATPYSYPTPPYETPYSYPTPPYSTPPYPAPYATPYEYPTPYGTPYGTPYETPPYGTPYVSPTYATPGSAFSYQPGQGGLGNCPVAGDFNIAECFHPARIAGYGDSTGFGRLASDILLILTSVAASLSIIFVVISGIKFVTSGGDPKNLASARSTLTYAIIGIVVTILAFVILRVVQFFLTGSANTIVL